MPKAIEYRITPTPTRRGLATCAAALAALAGLGATANATPPSPDAHLLALCAEFYRHHANGYNLPDTGDYTWEDAMEERWGVSDQIEDMNPMTAEGLRAKATVALVMLEEMREGSGDGVDRIAIATLRGLLGRT